MANPSRGDVWQVDLDPVRGHEQAGVRPCLVISVDPFNRGPADLAIVLPITRKSRFSPLTRGNRLLVPVYPPEGGLRFPSFIKCYDIRSVSQERFLSKWGTVTDVILAQIDIPLRLLLQLQR